MITQEITQLVESALDKLGLKGEVVLEHPVDLKNGDFSCNVAFVLAREVGESPKELAVRVLSAIPENKYIKKVEIAGSGFINFYLSDEFFTIQTKSILNKGDSWGLSEKNKGKTILLEHSSPNLFKPFHIGHLVNNSLGEALVRINSAIGAQVVALSFPSDISPGIAKTVWAILDKGWEDDLDINKIGEAYVYGVAQYENNKKNIDAINTSLYNCEEGTKHWEVYVNGREISLEYFKNITNRLGSQFDEFIYESEAEKIGKKVVIENTPKVFQESEGAIIFKGSEYGLFDNVFINSAGFGTYLAKDIGLIKIKFDKYNFDKSITITDVEQKHHFELVKKSAGLIKKEWEEKSEYIQHGRLELTSGKISSRDGGVPLSEEIIEFTKESVIDRMKENQREVDESTAEQVAIAAIKYAILRVGRGKNIVFDMETALALEGDTGPYLQYTYARAKSILRKVHDTWNSDFQVSRIDFVVYDVERFLYRFEEIVKRASDEQEPHYIANYLSELASAYNSWYAKEKVLDGSDTEYYKLAITQAVTITIKNGLTLLGIETPEKM